MYDQNISTNMLERQGGVLCWAAKWYGKPTVYFSSVRGDGREKMVKRMHALLTEADAVIHYNGKRFDEMLLNQEFLLARLGPTAPYKSIDLFQTAKSFRFPFAKLEYVLKATQIGAKVSHEGFPLWRKCMSRFPEYRTLLGDVTAREHARAWRDMEHYNKNDTTEMEPLYELMRPWIKNHPNHALYNNEHGMKCPSCNGTHLTARGYQRSKIARYQRFHCQDCGTWSKSRTKDSEVRQPDLTAA